MPTSSKVNERVYPIRGSIRFEVNDIESLEGERYSTVVKIGKCDWRLNVEVTEKSGNQKYLGVFLACMTLFDQGEIIDVEYSEILINQTQSGEDVFKKGFTKFKERSKIFGFSKLIEWSKLLSDGFVEDGKIFIVCDIVIKSEDVRRRRRLFDEERPNTVDLKNIFEVKKTSGIEEIEEEFEVSEVSEKGVCRNAGAVFGLPIEIRTKKKKENGKDYMNFYFYLNYEDKSDWWRAHFLLRATIVNQTDVAQSFSNFFLQTYGGKISNWGWSCYMEWSKLVDPASGYIKDGKFKMRISIQILEMLGFDENTRRGIDRSIRRMTDAVIAVGDKKLHVCKKILAQHSSHFKNLFSSNPGKLEFDFKNVQLDSFIKLLELIENADTDICEENADDVLKLIRTYKAPECYERIDLILKNLEFNDTLKVLELVDKYPLPKLRNKFLLKLKDEELLKSITHSPRYKNLSSDMKVAILEWKWIPEESRTESVEPTSYQFSTDFDEESDLTDIKINVNDYSYYASKQILANSSIFFLKKFYGPYSEDTPEVTVYDVSPREFEKLITHIYHPTRPVTSANIDSLLQLAQQFLVPRLMDKCEEYLVISDNIPLIDKLEYAGNFELPYLLESCLKFAKNAEKMKEVKKHHKFQHLSAKVLWELVKRESE